MSDLIVTDPQVITDSGIPLKRKFIDQSDGTWAEKIAGSGGSGISASQSLGAFQTVTLQDAAAALADGTSLNVSGMGTAHIAVTGTFVGTVTFETQDASGAWVAFPVQTLGSTKLQTSTTTTGVFRAGVGGFSTIRARVSAYTSGAITVTAFAENSSYAPAIQNIGIYEKLDAVNDSITNYPVSSSSTYISTATTTVVKTGAGHLARIVVGETAAGAITVYDNTAASGTVLAVLKASVVEGDYEFNCAFATGLTIVTAAASKITVVWR